MEHTKGTQDPGNQLGPEIDLNNFPDTEEIQTGFNPLAELERAWIDPGKEIDKPPTLLEIDGITTLTAGNISTVIGKAKSKKTFFMMGLLSAISSGEWGTLSGTCKDKTVLWFDTEQSLYHASNMIKRCHRLGAAKIEAYSLRGYRPAQRVEMIEAAIYNTPNLAFVAIDGQRDLMTRGINDEEEATEITSKFMKWTEELNIHIMVVLHTNKNDSNARGHIGTELQNKSEVVISVTKSESDKDTSIVVPDYARNRDFEPFAFTIDDTGLPVFTDMPEKAAGKEAKDPYSKDPQRHIQVLDSVFKQKPKYKYAELWQAIKTEWGKNGVSFGQGIAKDYLSYYKSENLVKKTDGFYYTYTRALF